MADLISRDTHSYCLFLQEQPVKPTAGKNKKILKNNTLIKLRKLQCFSTLYKQQTTYKQTQGIHVYLKISINITLFGKTNLIFLFSRKKKHILKQI